MFYGLFWPYNSMVTLVWSSEVFLEVFSEGQVKVRSKDQIFKFINVDNKGVYLDLFWLRNIMVSFVFAYDPRK